MRQNGTIISKVVPQEKLRSVGYNATVDKELFLFVCLYYLFVNFTATRRQTEQRTCKYKY